MFAAFYLQDDCCSGVLLTSTAGLYTVHNAWAPRGYESPQPVVEQWQPEVSLLNRLPDIHYVHQHPLAPLIPGDRQLAPSSNRFTDRTKFRALVQAGNIKLSEFPMRHRLKEYLNGEKWDQPLMEALVLGVVHYPHPLTFTPGSIATIKPHHQRRGISRDFGREFDYPKKRLRSSP